MRALKTSSLAWEIDVKERLPRAVRARLPAELPALGLVLRRRHVAQVGVGAAFHRHRGRVLIAVKAATSGEPLALLAFPGVAVAIAGAGPSLVQQLRMTEADRVERVTEYTTLLVDEHGPPASLARRCRT